VTGSEKRRAGGRPVFEAQQGMPVHQSFVVSPISIGSASTQIEQTRQTVGVASLAAIALAEAGD
jgi:hypothetical protein